CLLTISCGTDAVPLLLKEANRQLLIHDVLFRQQHPQRTRRFDNGGWGCCANGGSEAPGTSISFPNRATKWKVLPFPDSLSTQMLPPRERPAWSVAEWILVRPDRRISS